MNGMVKALFTEVLVEVEVDGQECAFRWRRLDEKQYGDITKRIRLAAVRAGLEMRRAQGEEVKPTDLEKQAEKAKDVMVKELTEHLLGWEGVPGEDGDLEFSREAAESVCDDRDWRLVIETTFFAAQDQAPEIVIKNASRPGAGGRPAETTTASS